MNDAQLLCFVSVAQTLSFRRAAEELELSQPSVTKQIASLENELGGTLFARSTRTVSLTDFGESFLPDAREILQIMTDASEKAKKKATDGHLIVGYNDVGQLYCISKVLEKYREKHPNVGITLKLGTRDDSTEWLNRGSLICTLDFMLTRWLLEALFTMKFSQRSFVLLQMRLLSLRNMMS